LIQSRPYNSSHRWSAVADLHTSPVITIDIQQNVIGAALLPGVAAAPPAAPPAALGRFISTLPGVVNKSGAALSLFHFQNNESVHNARVAITNQSQFRRCSPATAAAFGLPPSPSLVSFVQLERMDGVPQLLHVFGEV
jgi:hypothetical protein